MGRRSSLQARRKVRIKFPQGGRRRLEAFRRMEEKVRQAFCWEKGKFRSLPQRRGEWLEVFHRSKGKG